jgi:hypothetical protein
MNLRITPNKHQLRHIKQIRPAPRPAPPRVPRYGRKGR